MPRDSPEVRLSAAFDAVSYRRRNRRTARMKKLVGPRAVASSYACHFIDNGTVDAASIRIGLRAPVEHPRGAFPDHHQRTLLGWV